MGNVKNFSLSPGPTKEEEEEAEAFSWLISSCICSSELSLDGE